MRKRADRLPRLLSRKEPRPRKPPVEQTNTGLGVIPATLLDEVRERAAEESSYRRPLANRRARLRKMGLTLNDIYKVD